MADNNKNMAEEPVSGDAKDLRKQMHAMIRYKVECEDEYGPKFDVRQDSTPFDLQVTRDASANVDESEPVFEIITALSVASNRPKYYGGFFGGGAAGHESLSDSEVREPFGLGGDAATATGASGGLVAAEKKPPTLENKRILKIGETRMEIHSPWLLEAIREVIEFYPR